MDTKIVHSEESGICLLHLQQNGNSSSWVAKLTIGIEINENYGHKNKKISLININLKDCVLKYLNREQFLPPAV